jgi:hypothetical protein
LRASSWGALLPLSLLSGCGSPRHLPPFDASATEPSNDGATAADTHADTAADAPPDQPNDEPPRTPPGTILWVRSASTVFLSGVSESPTGVVVTGSMNAPANLGGALMAPGAAADTAIAQFAITDGAHLFSTRFGGSVPTGTAGIFGFLDTVDFLGSPLVAGVSFCDSNGAPICSKVDLGRGPVDPGGGPAADGFVGRYSVSTGTADWLTRLVGPGDDHFTSVTNGPSGTIYLAGWFDQSTALVSGSHTRMFTGGGDRDVLIAQLNATTGEIGMTRTFAGPGFEQATAIAWTGSHIIAAGFFAGTTAFGSKMLSSADFDIWVAKLLPGDGEPVWAVRLGGPGPDKYPYLVVDSAGDIYVAGWVFGSAALGGHSVGGAGGIDSFVAKLRNGDGGVEWATSFGSPGDDTIEDIAIHPSGQLLVTATISGPLRAGGPWQGGTDAAILSYNSGGTLLWTKVIGTSGEDSGGPASAGTNAFYADIRLGADIGPSIEGVAILGAPRPAGLVLKIEP